MSDYTTPARSLGVGHAARRDRSNENRSDEGWATVDDELVVGISVPGGRCN